MQADMSIAIGRVISRGGHHGLRLLAGLLIIVAIGAVVVLLLRAARRRRRRPPADRSPQPQPPPPTVPQPQPQPQAQTQPTVPRVSGPRPDGETISIRSLSKHYGAKVAVDELTFDVLPGRVTGFLGPNGAGKSTTMRVIMGLDAPTAGTATVNGRRTATCPGRCTR